MNVARAAAIPDVHLLVRADPSLTHALPGPKALKDALAGRRQSADPRLEGRFRIIGLDTQGAAVEHEDLQATVLQCQGQGTADHPGTDNQQICAHVHALSLSRLRF
ncbi:hypothetical protein D3C76_1096260 [compost metagenome]